MVTFIATEVLKDYTYGLVVVKAESLELARELVKREFKHLETIEINEIQDALVEMEDDSIHYVNGGS